MAPTGRTRRTKSNSKTAGAASGTALAAAAAAAAAGNNAAESSSSHPSPPAAMVGRPGRGRGHRPKGRPAKHGRGGRGGSLSAASASAASSSSAAAANIPASLPPIPLQIPLPPPPAPPPALPLPPTAVAAAHAQGLGNGNHLHTPQQRLRASPSADSPVSPKRSGSISKTSPDTSAMTAGKYVPSENADRANSENAGHSEEIINAFTQVLDSANLVYDPQSSTLTGDGVETPPTETQLTQLRLLLLKLRRKIVVEMLRQGASISAVRACVENYSTQEPETVNENHVSESRGSSIAKGHGGGEDGADEERREGTVIKIAGDGDKIHIKLEKRTISGPDDKTKKRKYTLVSDEEEDNDSGTDSRKNGSTPNVIKLENVNEEDDDNEFKIDLTSAIDSDSNKNENNDDQDDEGLRPRKKIRVKLEDDDEEESIKLIISKDKRSDKTTKEDDVFIPSVYRSDNPHANEVLDMDELVKTSMKELQLYEDEENRKTAKDEIEYKKRKYAVSEFPESDLKDMLPGEIPMIDFSGPKPTQQVAWNSFTAYIEPFYRNFTEEDVKWLKQKCVASALLSKYLLANEALAAAENSEDVNAESKGMLNGNGNKEARPGLDNTYNPYYIPPLGPKYSDVWSLENEGKPVKMGRLTQSLASKMKKLYAPKGSPGNFDVNKPEALMTLCEEPDKISCGPLTSRILSAIVSDDEDDVFELDENDTAGDDDDSEAANMRRDEKISFEQLEKRLNRELKYIGVFMNVVQTLNNSSWEQDWALGKEDDEVSSELRILQNELTEAQKRNNFRKEILVPIVEEQIAWQEYMTIVDDLDKQVEQHYRRRLNVAPKKTKKRGPHSGHSGADNSSSSLMKDDAAHLVSNASFRGLLDKRRRWIEKIGSLFKSPLEMRRMPKDTVFTVQKEEEEGDEEGEDKGEGGEEGEGEGEGEGKEEESVEGEEGKEEAVAKEGVEKKESEKSVDGKPDEADVEKQGDNEKKEVVEDVQSKVDIATADVKKPETETEKVASVKEEKSGDATNAEEGENDEEEDEEEDDEDDENEDDDEDEDEDEEEEDEEEEDEPEEDEEMAVIEEEPEEEDEEDEEEEEEEEDEENENDDDEEEEEEEDDDE